MQCVDSSPHTLYAFAQDLEQYNNITTIAVEIKFRKIQDDIEMLKEYLE